MYVLGYNCVTFLGNCERNSTQDVGRDIKEDLGEVR
jgi:hypothetical protein